MASRTVAHRYRSPNTCYFQTLNHTFVSTPLARSCGPKPAEAAEIIKLGGWPAADAQMAGDGDAVVSRRSAKPGTVSSNASS
jgi:hypothetical protein